MLLQAIALIAVGVWIYWPALNGMWLWDDDYLLQQNQIVQSPEGLWSIWSNPFKNLIDFFPLTVSIEWLEWQICPNNTTIFHVTGLVGHLVNCLLVWVLLRKLELRLAWLGAMIFVIHPVLVESVAWMAELKNTISGMPFLLTLCIWLEYDRKRRTDDYVICLVLYTMALLCKSSVMFFPFIILLHAWWRRLRIARQDFLLSLPFFLLSLLDGIGLILTLKRSIGDEFTPLGGVASRLADVGLSMSFYFSKCFLPVHLLPIYPAWDINPPSLVQFLPRPVLAGVLIYLWKRRRGWGRHALLGLGFFLIMLLPFCGFITIAFMRYGWVMDHMLYVPIIGLIGLAMAGLSQADLLLGARHRTVRVAGVILVCTAMAISSHQYAKIYQNTLELWGYEVRQYPEAWLARNNLGIALAAAHRFDEAQVQVEAALALNPLFIEAHSNLGALLMMKGHLTQAQTEFQTALKIHPGFDDAQHNLRIVQAQLAAGKPGSPK